MLVELIFCGSFLVSVGCQALLVQKMLDKDFRTEVRRDFQVAMVHWSPRVQRLYWDYMPDSLAGFADDVDTIVDEINPLDSTAAYFIVIDAGITAGQGFFFIFFYPCHVYVVVRETFIEHREKKKQAKEDAKAKRKDERNGEK
jgi:hypothetical protein